MKWIKITRIGNIPVREGRAVRIGGEEIAVFNLGDRIAAIDNKCPHGGGPLCDGMVSGDAVICPLHGWKISLDSGQIARPQLPACIDTYETKVEDGLVFLKWPAGIKTEDATA